MPEASTINAVHAFDLRTLGSGDAASYRDFLGRGLQQHPERFRLIPADLDREPSPMEGDPLGFTLGAYVDRALIGVVSVRREAQQKLRHKALLYRMYVDTRHTGRGFGRRLLDAAIERTRRLDGVLHLNLTVLADNPAALHLYETLGFVRFALESHAVFDGSTFHDECQMKLNFDSKHFA